MLHEILLSLSGYHSEIFQKVRDGEDDGGGLHKYVSEPEKAMLEVLANISRLHVEIKDLASQIAASHASVVCRAVGSAIAEHHLANFRKKVLDVEASVLKRDAGYVGAYEIVPLSTIVGEFAPWTRRLQWLQAVTRYINGHDNAEPPKSCSGKELLDYLQDATHTGYTDLEEMAMHLLICGQKVWMRSLASWVLYGKLPTFGADDFLIKRNPDSSDSIDQYVVNSTAVPAYITSLTAESILAIGNALNQIQAHGRNGGSSIAQSTSQSVALLSRHLQSLEALSYPLNAPMLEAVLLSIDQSISQNALARLLPLEQISSLLSVIHRFVLLGSGEFATSLIEQGAARLANREIQNSTKPVRKIGRVDDLSVKDPELGTILTKTWDELTALQLDQGLDDETFSFARTVLSLHGIPNTKVGEKLVSTWLSSPALLEITMSSDSTLRLFLDATSMKLYSSINSYLLSVRRAELQLSSLWKVTAQRRCHPTPLGPPTSSTKGGKQTLAARRAREHNRSATMRRHWASANKALFLVNELGGYLHGEVIASSWSQFEAWIREGNSASRPGSSRGSRPTTASSTAQQLRSSHLSAGSNLPQHRDPRTLAQGHRAFLRALKTGLLLDCEPFIASLRELLTLIDHYVALFNRLQTIWDGLDLQEDDGVVDAFSNYAKDEDAVQAEMTRIRELLENILTKLVTKLKEGEKQRLSDGIAGDLGQLDLQRDRFVPWTPRTMDRLIMRLDFLAGAREKHDANEVLDAYDDE